MMNNRIKCLILIIALFITKSQLYVFSQTNSNNTIQNITGRPPDTPEGSVELDGQIGEWDPDGPDALDFNKEGLEIEGSKPTEGEYYTISVTVPLSMEFYVLPNSQLAFGSFYSPEYKITNNGSKNLEVKINSFSIDTTRTIASDETPLYIDKVKGGDGKTQMELKLSAIDSSNTANNKEIDLTEIETLQDNEKKLYELSKNETKKVKFSAERWELPQFESGKDKAISNFKAGFEFSIKR